MLQYRLPAGTSWVLHLSQAFSADNAPASDVSSVSTASRCRSCCFNHCQGFTCLVSKVHFIGSIADRQCCYCSSICCSACSSCQSRYFDCFCSWNSSIPSSAAEHQCYYCSNTHLLQCLLSLPRARLGIQQTPSAATFSLPKLRLKQLRFGTASTSVTVLAVTTKI